MLTLATQIYTRALSFTGRLSDIVQLITRLFIANVFWQSAMVKLMDWESTLFLFAEEYKVPLLPPDFAAYSGTFFELTCPLLLAFGLASRLAALPLLAMTAVIQFTYMPHADHGYWALLLANILCIGPGRFSIDYFIKRHFIK